jgi:hypothetical protein
MRRLALLGGLLAVSAALAGGASASNTIVEVNDPAWSGYAASDATFTHVTGSWVEPHASCAGLGRGTKTMETTWVGLDGFNSNTVEQAGTEANCNGTTESHFAWYEFFPTKFVQLPGTVQGGDHMSVDVAKAGSNVTITISDSDETWSSFTTSMPVNSKEQFSSAEWIVESLSQKLTDFTTISFTNAQADAGGGLLGPADGAWTTTRLTMVSNNGQKTTPKDTVHDLVGGTSFDVDWNHS